MSLSPVSFKTAEELDLFLKRYHDTNLDPEDFLVADNGETYHVSEIENSTDENILFVYKDGSRCSIKTVRNHLLKKDKASLANLIHNKPLVEKLKLLKKQPLEEISLTICPVADYPPLFPVITDNEDVFEKAELERWLLTSKQNPTNRQPCEASQIVPNKALQDLSWLISVEKKKCGLLDPLDEEYIQETLNKKLQSLDNEIIETTRNDKDYEELIARKPKWQNKSLHEVNQLLNTLPKERDDLVENTFTIRRLLSSLTFYAGVGGVVGALAVPALTTGVGGIIFGSVIGAVFLGSLVAHCICALYTSSKVAKMENKLVNAAITKKHLETHSSNSKEFIERNRNEHNHCNKRLQEFNAIQSIKSGKKVELAPVASTSRIFDKQKQRADEPLPESPRYQKRA